MRSSKRTDTALRRIQTGTYTRVVFATTYGLVLARFSTKMDHYSAVSSSTENGTVVAAYEYVTDCLKESSPQEHRLHTQALRKS